MYKARQGKLSQGSSSEGWALAIEQAEQGITKAKERIEKLERSIEVFTECKKRGEPWPGMANSPDQSGSQPSGGVGV